MRQWFAAILEGLLIFSLLAGTLPLWMPQTQAAIAQPLHTSTVPVTLNFRANPRLVQPSTTLRFTPSGAVYAMSSGENVSVSASFGFTSFLYNSTYVSYRSQVLNCIIAVSYSAIPRSSAVEQTIAGTGCNPGTMTVAIGSLLGHKPTSPRVCELDFIGFVFSWCNSAMAGVSVSYSANSLRIISTSNTWSFDPTLQTHSAWSCTSNANPYNCTSGSLTFSASGDSIIIMATAFSLASGETTTFTTTDSKSDSYTDTANKCVTGAECTGIAYAVGPSCSSCAFTITVKETGGSSGTLIAVWWQEWSGLGSGALASATGTGSCTSSCGQSYSASSTSFTAISYVAVAVTTVKSTGTPSWSAGSQFSLDTDVLCGTNAECAEYSTTVTSSTTFPMSTTGLTVTNWAESGAVIWGTVTQPINCPMQNTSPSNPTMALTSTGATPSPTTVTCDGTSYNITVEQGTTTTATEPADASTTRYRLTGTVTSLTNSECTSGTCSTWTINNWYQYSLQGLYSSLTNSLSATRFSAGSSGSVTSNDWYDSDSSVTIVGLNTVTYTSPNFPIFVYQFPAVAAVNPSSGFQLLLNGSATNVLQSATAVTYSQAGSKAYLFVPSSVTLNDWTSGSTSELNRAASSTSSAGTLFGPITGAGPSWAISFTTGAAGGPGNNVGPPPGGFTPPGAEITSGLVPIGLAAGIVIIAFVFVDRRNARGRLRVPELPTPDLKVPSTISASFRLPSSIRSAFRTPSSRILSPRRPSPRPVNQRTPSPNPASYRLPDIRPAEVKRPGRRRFWQRGMRHP